MSDTLPSRLRNHTTVGGKKLLAGIGPAPARIMLVFGAPRTTEVASTSPFTSNDADALRARLIKAGLAPDDYRWTYAVKYSLYNDKNAKMEDISACRDMLQDEIDWVNPEVIVPLGTQAFQACMGPGYKITAYQHSFIESARFPGRLLYPMPAPGFIRRNPHLEYQYQQGFSDLSKKLAGADTDTAKIDYTLITSDDQFAELLAEMASNPRDVVFLDCEWEGDKPTDPGAYIRTMQLNIGKGENYIVRFYPCSAGIPGGVDPAVVYPDCADIRRCMAMLRTYLETCSPKLAGHGVRADGRRILHYGTDIRNYVVYDTMIAEHLINNNSMFDLTSVTIKYTSYGRYDAKLEAWLKEHSELVENGYGAVPEELLMEYGAYDVEVPREVMLKQLDQLEPYRQPLTGIGRSLFDLAMINEADLYELEEEGLQIDNVRLQELIKKYHAKRRDMERTLLTMVMQRGFDETFNHRSTDQVRNLLFGKPETDQTTGRQTGPLGLVPIYSTGKPSKRWDWVVRQPPHIRKHYSPSTDKSTLDILQTQHPIVKQLRDLRKIDQVCKNFLREDDAGGVTGCIWPDGKLHPEYNPLLDTGRLGTRRPNTQNWSKSAEDEISRIFTEEEGRPAPMRSICVPGDGWVFVEGDLIQAELFVLAGLSDDQTMLGALTTPGKDLHDTTAINSFNLTVLLDGHEVDERWLLDVAAADEGEFKNIQSKLVYRTFDGRMLSRKEFKNSIRVSAKAVSFGLPYGRGAAAIATQINAATGMNVSADEIKKSIDGWKSTYAQAWAYLQRCQQHVLNPGYTVGAWGRRRYFPAVNDESMIAAMQRQAANFSIQNTVADTMRIAMHRVMVERDRQQLRARVVNQIHDALLIRAPLEEVDAVSDILHTKMGGIPIPLPNGNTLGLGVEIELFSRWGVAV